MKTKKCKNIFASIFISTICLSSTQLSASLIEDEISITSGYDVSKPTPIVMTGEDPESILSFFGNDRFELDIDSESIEIIFIPDSTIKPQGVTVTFSDLDWIENGVEIEGQLTGFSLTNNGSPVGNDAVTVGNDANGGTVSVDLTGIWNQGDSVTINLEVEHTSTVVPEPATYAMLGSALGVAAFARRKKAARAAR